MRTMQIGRLNKRVTFVQYEDAVNSLGQSKKVLNDYKTVWATFAPVRGREYYDAQKIRSDVTYKMYCRYVKDISSDMFIRYDGKLFEITSVIDVDLEHKMLEIYAVEKVKKLKDVSANG